MPTFHYDPTRYYDEQEYPLEDRPKYLKKHIRPERPKKKHKRRVTLDPWEFWKRQEREE